MMILAPFLAVGTAARVHATPASNNLRQLGPCDEGSPRVPARCKVRHSRRAHAEDLGIFAGTSSTFAAHGRWASLARHRAGGSHLALAGLYIAPSVLAVGYYAYLRGLNPTSSTEPSGHHPDAPSVSSREHQRRYLGLGRLCETAGRTNPREPGGRTNYHPLETPRYSTSTAWPIQANSVITSTVVVEWCGHAGRRTPAPRTTMVLLRYPRLPGQATVITNQVDGCRRWVHQRANSTYLGHAPRAGTCYCMDTNVLLSIRSTDWARVLGGKPTKRPTGSSVSTNIQKQVLSSPQGTRFSEELVMRTGY